MNAPAKVKAADKPEAPDNLRLWNALGKTDPAHTKQFKRSGGFSGTALKPIWVEKRLTELFGPCGIGWGTDEPSFRIVEAGDEMLVYCTVRGWYLDNGTRAEVYGVGGDKVVSKTKYGLSTDDEAFKKACTDAIGNAFKHVGVGADIHMGQFDDSKYVQAVAKEFAANDEAAPVAEVAGKEKDGDFSPSALKQSLRLLVHHINGCGDLGELIALLADKDAADTIEQCRRRAPAWWETGEGMPKEFVPLKTLIDQRKAELEQAETQSNRQRTVLDAG